MVGRVVTLRAGTDEHKDERINARPTLASTPLRVMSDPSLTQVITLEQGARVIKLRPNCDHPRGS